MIRASAVTLIALATVAANATSQAGEEEQPAEIIAVQIRKQGFECQKPKSAVLEHAQSKPDEPVWILQCENATYRVRLVPDLAAEVERSTDFIEDCAS
jgi:hypothetical protein